MKWTINKTEDGTSVKEEGTIRGVLALGSASFCMWGMAVSLIPSTEGLIFLGGILTAYGVYKHVDREGVQPEVELDVKVKSPR